MERIRGGGEPLPASERRFLEPRFGMDFGNVRIHRGPGAARVADAIGARAFTVGTDIAFGAGQYRPGSGQGRRLLAHELAHVVQQGDGERDAVRRDVLGTATEMVTQPFENIHPGSAIGLPLSVAFDQVVNTSILTASAISIPAAWRLDVAAYAVSNPLDGAFLLPGLARLPSFWRGGWIMQLQPNAAAMTLDDDIFATGPLSLSTFAHELVHVTQYNVLGKVGFLTSYFGLSAATIAARFVLGQPLRVMRSSPHEDQAYQIERRFNAWYSSNRGGSAGGVTV